MALSDVAVRKANATANISMSCQIAWAAMSSLTASAHANPASKWPLRSPRSCSARDTSNRRISISGPSSQQRASHDDRRGLTVPSEATMRSVPR